MQNLLLYKLRYRVLWRPRHCDVKSADGDDVTMVMEYHGERGDGKSVESERAVAMKLNKQQGSAEQSGGRTQA